MLVRVALDVPLSTLFDYRAPATTTEDIGCRVLVPFGRKIAVGVIVERASTSAVAPQRLRTTLRLLRDISPLPADLLRLLKFCSDYYQYPIGATIFGALPARLRRPLPIPASPPADLPMHISKMALVPGPPLSPEQDAALSRVRMAGAGFKPWLLHGVTGSGKTEVYFQLIADALKRGEQSLMLVPEINLTPQLELQIMDRFPETPFATLHSGLNEGERLNHWLAAQSGRARIILGTRSAVFAPLPKLGLIIVDEEHDTSFKQMEGLHYSARDIALMRAKWREIPIVLGSATPAYESLQQALTNRWQRLTLSHRINATLPRVDCIDVRREPMSEGLSKTLIAALEKTLEQKEQSLIFINRRGYAPVLMCSSCSWTSDCHRCAAKLVLHLAERRLRCHHCGYQALIPPACPTCGNQDLVPVGQGTQRIEFALARALPSARILRIDRDSTRRKHAWRQMREQIQSRQVDVLVGTQMLAKGHDFPQLTVVGILNADGALYSTDFRAAERVYSRLAQVAGRAGRAARPGRVFIQTAFPHHPLYQALCRHDYDGFAKAQLAERKQAGLPPFTYQAVLRAEARSLATVMDFLEEVRRLAPSPTTAVTLLDAVPATMTRRGGLERGHLVIESSARRSLQHFLAEWRMRLEKSAGTKVRWMLDVDPIGF